MKINSQFTLEISRNADGFLAGFVLVDGVRQRLSVIPRGVEFSDFVKFLQTHVESGFVVGNHGNIPFRRGKGLRD